MGIRKRVLKSGLPVPLPQVQKDYEEWLIKSEYKPGVNVENHDTIGMLALDASGRMAVRAPLRAWPIRLEVAWAIVPLLAQGCSLTEMPVVRQPRVGEAMIRTAGASMWWNPCDGASS